MADDNAKLYAVLTGDLVKSSKLSPDELDEVRTRLLDGVATVATWRDGLVVGQAEFFRGDSWQLLLADSGQALRVALYLRASLRAQDRCRTRVAIGFGTVDQINCERVSLSTGEAFVLSGHALDSMKKVHLAISLPPSSLNIGEWVGVVGQLCDAIVDHWSAKQAQAIMLAISPPKPTEAEIAGHLGVKQQTVHNSLRIASWNAIEAAIEVFERRMGEGYGGPTPRK